jgi:hypothetical protein
MLFGYFFGRSFDPMGIDFGFLFWGLPDLIMHFALNCVTFKFIFHQFKEGKQPTCHHDGQLGVSFLWQDHLSPFKGTR